MLFFPKSNFKSEKYELFSNLALICSTRSSRSSLSISKVSSLNSVRSPDNSSIKKFFATVESEKRSEKKLYVKSISPFLYPLAFASFAGLISIFDAPVLPAPDAWPVCVAPL